MKHKLNIYTFLKKLALISLLLYSLAPSTMSLAILCGAASRSKASPAAAAAAVTTTMHPSSQHSDASMHRYVVLPIDWLWPRSQHPTINHPLSPRCCRSSGRPTPTEMQPPGVVTSRTRQRGSPMIYNNEFRLQNTTTSANTLAPGELVSGPVSQLYSFTQGHSGEQFVIYPRDDRLSLNTFGWRLEIYQCLGGQRSGL